MESTDYNRDRIEAIIEVFEAEDGALWRAYEQIAESPHRALIPEAPLVSPADATAIAPHLLLQSLLEPDAIAITDRKPHFECRGERWRILKVYDDRSRINYDTPPNRFAAHLLRTLLNELRKLLRQLHELNGSEAGDGNLLEDARWLRRRMRAALASSDALRNSSILREIPHGDLVLGHDARYRRVMAAWVDLMV